MTPLGQDGDVRPTTYAPATMERVAMSRPAWQRSSTDLVF